MVVVVVLLLFLSLVVVNVCVSLCVWVCKRKMHEMVGALTESLGGVFLGYQFAVLSSC